MKMVNFTFNMLKKEKKNSIGLMWTPCQGQ